MNDPYSILGVPFGASSDDCKMAYRKLAKQYHPDVNRGDPKAEERFKDISAAYDAIINPPNPTMPPHGFSQNGFTNFHFNMGAGTPFEELFSHLNGQQRNTTYEIRLSLEEAYQGKEITIQAPGQHGAAARDITVKVPPGVEDGMRLVVQQAGQQANAHMRPGDLHILLRIIPHSRFARIGLNLVTTVPVTAFDVLLGNDIEVIGIAGNAIRVAIPRGFDSSRKLRLAGQGMVDGRGVHGDLLVDLFIQYPNVPDQHLEALRTIAQASI